MTTRGRCLCGGVAFAYEGAPLWQGYCHCESCRRATGSPVAAFIGVDSAGARIGGETLAVHDSSPGVRRSFCRRCGTPLAYQADRFPGELHFYAAGLERPQDFVPQFHVFYEERLPWFDLDDGLPRYRKGSDGAKMGKDES
ncbi:MAG: GFA family protein [Rhodovibrionaceae bacterium]